MPHEFWTEFIKFIERWRKKCPERINFLRGLINYAEDREIVMKVKQKQLDESRAYFEKWLEEGEDE